MGIIRQYLKQKVARTFSGRRVDLDVVKKEIKDELTHVLYDQTRRTPIVIPVINEIGGGGKPQHDGGGQSHSQGQPGDNRDNGPRPNQGYRSGNQGGYNSQNRTARPSSSDRPSFGGQSGGPENGPMQPDTRPPEPRYERPAPKSFPAPMVPDTETVEPKSPKDVRGY
jgi:hypothetical protein